eukprot:5668935-Amphidinium_carterae.1
MPSEVYLTTSHPPARPEPSEVEQPQTYSQHLLCRLSRIGLVKPEKQQQVEVMPHDDDRATDTRGPVSYTHLRAHETEADL